VGNYKIIRFSGVGSYPVFAQFLGTLGDGGRLGYEELYQAYKQRKFIYSNGFPEAMSRLGNEVYESFYDFELLQKKWAAEHGVAYSVEGWRQEIVLAQIAHYEPDVLYLTHTRILEPPLLKECKRRFPFLRVVASQRTFPGEAEELCLSDILFTGVPGFVDLFRSQGVNAHLLYHAFDGSLLPLLSGPDADGQKAALAFVGSSGYGYGASHKSRFELLGDCFARTPIQGWLYEPGAVSANGERPLGERYPGRVHAPVYGLDMYRTLARAGIVLNIHTDAAGGQVGNMRMFEATGAGACLLTDTGTNMADLFEPGSEVVTYDCAEDCLEKIAYLLDNDAVRADVAARGRKRTLKDHTVYERCRVIDEEITRRLGQG
jgi:spore maturation protein CgeB